MNNHPYWQQQDRQKPLFPDIEWNKPEQRTQAGKLGIVGGNRLGFAGVAEAYTAALAAGVGEARVLLPDALKKSIPAAITDTIFGPTTLSGSLAGDAKAELQALSDWADGILLIGDAGRSSETAIAYEAFVSSYTGPLTVTRDAVDLLKNSPAMLVERPATLLVVSFAQLQKLFQSVYYPKILTFSMQLTNLVEALHKFTTTYSVGVMALHKDFLLVAEKGNVTSTAWENPMTVWRGHTAARAASYWLWRPDDVFSSATAALASETSKK